MEEIPKQACQIICWLGSNVVEVDTMPNDVEYWKHTQHILTLTVLVTTIDTLWEGMGDVGSARYEPALLPPCPTIRVLSYSN